MSEKNKTKEELITIFEEYFKSDIIWDMPVVQPGASLEEMWKAFAAATPMEK